MKENQPLGESTQRKLRFSGDSVWQRLPESSCLECRELIARLLGEVVGGEGEQERADERKISLSICSAQPTFMCGDPARIR